MVRFRFFILTVTLLFLFSCTTREVKDYPQETFFQVNYYYPNLVTNYGIAGYGRSNIDFQFKKMAEGGLQIIRREIAWSDVERVRGEFDFSWYDQVVDLANSYGLKYLGILAYGNRWASEKGSQIGGHEGDFYPPDNLEDFANYVYTTVQHYRGKIKMWEVWNEPNGGYRFWKSSLVGDPKGYAELLKVAYASVKKACPECLVSYAGLFYHQEAIMGAVTFLEKSFEAAPDLDNYFDAIAYHPYPFYPPLAAPESDQFIEVPIYIMNENILSVLKMNGVSKPLWITEIGWPTIYSLTEEMQAEYLVRSFVLSYATGASMYLYFTFWDSDINRAIVPPEAEFGLFNYPYSTTDYESLAKKGWFAYVEVVKFLGGKWFSGICEDVKIDPLTQFALKFTSATEKVCVVWSKSGREKLKIINQPDVILDIYGRSVTLPEISESPLYLIWKESR